MVPTTAAISAGDVRSYEENEAEMNGTAWAAVRHSEGYGAPAHVEEPGEMARSCAVVRDGVLRNCRGTAVGVVRVRRSASA